MKTVTRKTVKPTTKSVTKKTETVKPSRKSYSAPAQDEPEILEVAEPKVKKEKVRNATLTLDRANEMAAAAKVNVGKQINFTAFATKVEYNGVIKSVWIDKRYPAVLYKIKTSDGQTKNKVVNSSEITII